MGKENKETQPPINFTEALQGKISPIDQGIFLSILLNQMGIEAEFAEYIDKMVAVDDSPELKKTVKEVENILQDMGIDTSPQALNKAYTQWAEEEQRDQQALAEKLAKLSPFERASFNKMIAEAEKAALVSFRQAHGEIAFRELNDKAAYLLTQVQGVSGADNIISFTQSSKSL